MATSQDLLRELAQIERDIDALRDHRRELELGCRYAGYARGAYPLRRLFLFALRRDLERRIYLLRLRYGAAYNSYLLLRREESGEAGSSTKDPPSPAAASRRSPLNPALRRGSR